MRDIAETLSKGIKEGKWIDIEYNNQSGETTYFWIAIKDINPNRKSILCDIFNFQKSPDTFEQWIKFDGIKKAETLYFASYDVPEKLYIMLEKNSPDWLHYDRFNNNILNYYQECSVLDNDPYQKDYCMIPGIDLSTLRKEKRFYLDETQEKILFDKVYHNGDTTNTYNELIISVFAISKNTHKYVICYYPLTYNPKDKSLIVSSKLLFNQSFLIEGTKKSLQRYIDSSVEEFIAKFKDEYKECREEIESHLYGNEIIDTRPDIMLLQRDVTINLQDTYKEIEKEYYEKNMSKPLEAFFGNLTRRRGGTKKPSLVLFDSKVNIDQMRVLYNSMTQPVTYVQGPPGTGKTQTILNVILCAFVQNESVLVCSSNNTPVDGIKGKFNFKYYDKDVPFPFLRLGNNEEVAKSTRRIYELYQFNEKRQPNDKLISEIIENNDKNNEILRDKLSDYERRLDLEELILSGNKLIASFDNRNSGITNKIKQKNKENEDKLNAIPEVKDEEVLSLFKPVSNDNRFLSFLYFQSVKFISKLKQPKYKDLIELCSILDDAERIKQFNSWTKNDDNMKKLLQVFPIILSTNISSNKLGSSKTKFDLVIMDEAGQCNVAHALIPLVRAKSLLLVGDINQLRPVIVLEDNINDELLNKYNVDKSYSYKGNSILSIMKNHDSVSKNILLSYHYRCGKYIINFSNKRYYKSELKIDKIPFSGELEFIEVENKNKSKMRNANIDETIGIIDYIKRNNVKDATIITPFLDQENLVNQMLEKEGIKDVSCGTIHSLQGAEKDTIIFSTSISPSTSRKTFDWLKNNSELINVGVTRAKKKLVIASDYEALQALSNKDDDLYALVDYVRNNGKVNIAPSINCISIGKSNNSKAEDEFYSTISQFCSTHKSFEADRNVAFSKIFKDDPELSKLKMEFDLVLYKSNPFFRKRTVAIVIEINGGEHFGDQRRERCDQKKRLICKQNGWKFISIPNTFVKSYEEIREIILSTKGKQFEQMALFD